MEDAGTDIDQGHIHQDQARSRFLSEDERRLFPPSRIAETRRAQAEVEGRRAAEADGLVNGVSGGSGTDGGESVARKLARLRREILELQDQIQQGQETFDQSANSGGESVKTEFGNLEALLDAAQATYVKQNSASNRLLDQLGKQPAGLKSTAPKQPDPLSIPAAQSATEVSADDSAHAIVIRLDGRLKALEDALGLDALPSEGPDGLGPKPILPTLDALEKQYTTLTNTSQSSIEKISDRIKRLAEDASMLEANRIQARKALENLMSTQTRIKLAMGGVVDNAPSPSIVEDQEQVSKINALYATLSTIESIMPILPQVMERLKSLRDLHADAANASQDLADLEREQQAMEEDLATWKNAVAGVEQNMQGCHDRMKENTDTVEEWVQDLEKRVANFKS